MARQTVCLILVLSLASACSAADALEVDSIVKVYPVGDLVSVGAMNVGFGRETTAEEWASNYPETLKALEDLKELVQTMCSHRPVAVSTYAPSLSLIVRHSPEGHDEIEALLGTLDEGNAPTLQLECRALYSQSPDELRGPETTDAQYERIEVLLSMRRLTSTETTELLGMLPDRPLLHETVVLKSGQRTAWGPPGRPCTAMGRIDRKTNSIELRIDFVADDPADSIPFGSTICRLGEGESELFHHYCDGGLVIWLVTAKILDQTPSTVISRTKP